MGRFVEIVTDDERNELWIDDSVIYYRRFDSQVYRDIEKRHSKNKGRDRTGQPIIETDQAAINDDVLDYVITGWGTVVNPTTKEPVPCTREYKLKLSASVRLQVIQMADSDRTMGPREEDQKKTSGSTPAS